MSTAAPYLPSVRIPRVDGIEVRSLLGRGGMGAVFAGRDTGTGGPVALKVIAGPADELSRARFAAEVDALAHIHDPHVVRLRASGAAQGIPYAVLDRVGGFGLERLRRALPWPIVVDLARQLAEAIAAVHAAGYVHRDIKPSNVIIGRRGNLTLIDFGVAKRQDEPELVPGESVGTPRFLSPEVAAGHPATPRSDLYGLGLVVDALLGSDPAADTPAELRALVAQCLEADPERRPASAAAIVAVLARLPSRRARLRRCVFEDVAIVAAPVDEDADTRPLRREACRRAA